MLTQDMNDRIARVGPGTPGGELFRRYWLPFMPSAKLDEDPVQPVRLLGEDLTCYKDKSGNVGLIGQRCLHRAVDLRYGIPDENGLRCPYHGWLYDSQGSCIEAPLEARPDMFKDRIKLSGYPVKEMGGLLFAYMGPNPVPLLPPWDLFVWPNSVRQIGYAVLNANWLQCQENTGDPAHGVYLHGHLFEYSLQKMGDTDRLERMSKSFHNAAHGIKDLYVHQTEYGMEKGILYSKELGAAEDKKTRHSTVIFPFYTEQNAAGAPWSEFQIRVPIDDEHTYHINYNCYAAPPGVEAPKQDFVPYYEVPVWDEDGKPILDCILNQDFVGWWSQGPLTDRTAENLGRTDIPVVFLRKQIDENIKIVEDGGDPMNVFRDPTQMGGILYGGGAPAETWTDPNWAKNSVELNRNTRAQYHKGGATWESDRYGPAIPLVGELHRRMEEAVEQAKS
ncbi:MAG: Rieske (2Fe-2S) protein [Chloroflexi bacterium]|nr:Rieske (2Fe-2S) protein [Chloroflexota bacterium]